MHLIWQEILTLSAKRCELRADEYVRDLVVLSQSSNRHVSPTRICPPVVWPPSDLFLAIYAPSTYPSQCDIRPLYMFPFVPRRIILGAFKSYVT